MEYSDEEEFRVRIGSDDVKKVAIEGVSGEAIVGMIVERIVNTYDFMTPVNRTLEELTRNKLTSMVNAEIERQIRESVEQKIAEGWADHSLYGTTSKVKTLAERVGEFLTSRAPESYGRQGADRTVLTKLVHEAVEASVTKAMKDELEVIRKRFAEQVDAVLNAKLAETLRKSLGL